MIENIHFVRFLQYCNPAFRPISRRTLGRDIHDLYTSLLQQMRQRLQDHIGSGGKINLTLDAWSSPTQVAFLGITSHYIELDTWQFRSVLLGFERLRGSHSAEGLARVVLCVLRRFQITSHIRAMTTDNASVNTKMLALLQDSLPGFSQQDGQIRCMAHIINLAAQQILSHLDVAPTEHTVYAEEEGDNSTGFTTIAKAFSYARKIISKIRASNKLWESFEAQTLAAKLPSLKLILDMRIRYILPSNLFYIFTNII